MQAVIQSICQQHQLKPSAVKPLSGGDINEVFLLKCTSESYVLKLNLDAKYPGMFEAETRGLQLLAASESFVIPKVVNHGTELEYTFLLMEYIPAGEKESDFWEQFAKNLAKLHRTTHSFFGLDHSNYIGSLPQQNNSHDDAAQFYISERLEPQLRMAVDGGYSFPGLDLALRHIGDTIPKEPPSLVHGDLWGGNYLVSEKGKPVLIDPAVAFAPREMDFGMMKLFGGFSSEVYTRYNEIFPLTEGWEERIPLWQLYYLLVHLNLFGSGYLSRVRDILGRYT